MVVPSANMTRSFINPKDRAAEVAKRRQEFETELQRRREDKIRQIQERSENAFKRKQMGLQEKLNKHKTEADHLKEINKRRVEKENEEKRRLQQLLEKKRSPPRTTQNSAKPKATVAFGSRVARQLEFNKSSSSGRSASTSSANGTLNTTKSSLMTRSVHPVMSPARSKPSPTKPVSRPPPRPINNNRLAPRITAPSRKAPENRMSRSVHPELCPTPNKRIERPKPTFTKKTVAKLVTKPVPIRAGARPPIKAEALKIEAPVVEAPIVQVEEAPVKESEFVSEIVIEPIQQVEEHIKVTKEPEVFRPVQHVEEKIEIESMEEPEIVQVFVPVIEPIIESQVQLVKEEEPKTEAQPNDINLDQLVPAESQHIVTESRIVDESVAIEPIATEDSTPRATEFGQLLSFDSSNEETPEMVPPSDFVHNRSSSDDRDSTRTRTITPQPVFSDDEHDSGVVPETPSPPIEKESTVIEPMPRNNQMFLLNTNIASFSPTEQEVETPIQTKTSFDTITSHEDTNGTHFEQTRVSVSSIPADPEQTNVKDSPSSNGALANGVVLGLTEKLQQERDNRRAKLNEILSRTREQSNSSSPVKTESDASALAKNLLARRSERLNEPKQSDNGFQAAEQSVTNGSEQKLVSLADEFENLGLSSKQELFLLPGQLPDTHKNNGVSG